MATALRADIPRSPALTHSRPSNKDRKGRLLRMIGDHAAQFAQLNFETAPFDVIAGAVMAMDDGEFQALYESMVGPMDRPRPNYLSVLTDRQRILWTARIMRDVQAGRPPQPSEQSEAEADPNTITALAFRNMNSPDAYEYAIELMIPDMPEDLIAGEIACVRARSLADLRAYGEAIVRACSQPAFVEWVGPTE